MGLQAVETSHALYMHLKQKNADTDILRAEELSNTKDADNHLKKKKILQCIVFFSKKQVWKGFLAQT